VTEINGLAPSEDPHKQINSMWLLTTEGPTCSWEVWAERARDIGVPDLGLGLEAEPEAGYSTASRRGSLARTRDAMLLFRQRNSRPGGDPGGIKTREPGRLVTSLTSLSSLSEETLRYTSLSAVRLNSCVRSALGIILFALDALSWSYHISSRER